VPVSFAVTAIGRDRPGIVAAISGVLAELGANIEDARMAILRGNFAVMLIAALPDSTQHAGLESRLEAVREELGLETISVSEIPDSSAPPNPSHVLTVYGADHPGIVHAFARALADAGANITDLEARLAGTESSPIYALVMELEPATGADVGQLRGLLEETGRQAGVDVSLREIGAEAL
jgi:glycine cleavage system transcriptional repressor